MPRWLGVNPRYASLVRAHALDNIGRVMGWASGELVGEHQHRDSLRLELPDEGGRRILYLKREFRTQLKDLLRGLLRGEGLKTKARHEWEVLSALQAEGVGCPEPVAFAQTGVSQPCGYLVVTALPGSPLTHWLMQPEWTSSRRFRRSLLKAVAGAVAALHRTGFDHPDLYCKHVFASREGGQWRISLLDFQRSRRYATLPRTHRWRDLAALHASVGPHAAGRSDRLFFLKCYLWTSGLGAHDREAIKAILRLSAGLLERRKIREFHLADAVEGAPAQRLIRFPGGSMRIDRRYEHLLSHAELGSFDAVMHGTSGTLLRTLPDRENWRLELGNGRPGLRRTAYLKRHQVGGPLHWLRARLGLGAPVSAGWQEARNVRRLWRSGIASMHVIASGQKVERCGRLESFFLTAEVPDAVPLDAFLRGRFGQGQFAPQTPVIRLDSLPSGCHEHVALASNEHWRDASATLAGRRRLRSLIDAVADLARRFHAMGYNHRDFYCCHILVREPAPGRLALHLIDLQRMQYRRRLRRRWIVKDLAQLSYSAPREVVRAADRLRFFKRYLGVERLGKREKRLARRILVKHRWIARRGIAP